MARSRPKRPPVLSCGAVVVRRGAGAAVYLLLRAYRHWDFPKGIPEAGETPLAAARREVEEETGLRDLEFPWGLPYRETEVYAGNKRARFYLAESPRGQVVLPVSPELGRPEHHEFRWLSYAEARARLGERLRAVLDWAHDTVAQGPPGPE